MKTKVIAFANNKGGSGKTTTASNVAASMALMGKRVLVIDGDMQMNLTLSFFDEERAIELATGEKNIYHAIKGERDLSDFVFESNVKGLDFIPSSSLMSGIEFDLFSKWQRELILKKCLAPIIARGYYDYVIIDAPPTLGGWVMNIMCASDFVVIPVEASPWGLFGLANMFDFIGQVKSIAPALEVLGIAITKLPRITTHRMYLTVKSLRHSRSAQHQNLNALACLETQYSFRALQPSRVSIV